MRIGILTFGRPQARNAEPPYEPKKLLEAAQTRGHEARIFCEPFFSFRENVGQLEILYDNEPMPSCEVIIPRTNLIEDIGLHSITIDLLHSAGYKVINGDTVTALTAKNKLTRKLLLSRAKIPTPRSTIVRDVSTVPTEAQKIGFPIIAKTPNGSGGRGIFLSENLETLIPIVDYLTASQKVPVLLEEFIKEAKGKDLRIFVAGDKIIAAMEREAKIGDIRSNIHAGGIGRPVELTAEEEKMAICATKAVGLEIAGVDLIRSNRGPLIIEVNARPGFEGLEQATGVDVADGIIDYVTRNPVNNF